MPARFCPHCRHEVGSTARFCPNCAVSLSDDLSATPVAYPPPGQSYQPLPQAAVSPLGSAVERSKTMIMVVLGLAVIALIICVFVLTSHPHGGVLSSTTAAPPPATPPLVAAPTTPATGAPPLVAAPATTVPGGPPVISANSLPTGSLPADVYSYLKFVEGIEKRRLALNSDLDSAASMLTVAHQMQGSSQNPDLDQGTTDSQNGVSKLSKGFGDYSTKWQALIRDYDAVPPPDPCQPMAMQYHKFLSEYSDTISKLQVSLLNGDVAGAMQMEDAQKTITVDGIQADTDLTALCNSYNAPKPFNIQPEDSSPTLITQ